MKYSIYKDIVDTLPKFNIKVNSEEIERTIKEDERKIIVLDDDPTGVQTVYGVLVLTSWDKETLIDAFLDDRPLFFVLTNSRSMTAKRSEVLHREIMKNIIDVSKYTGKDFEIISRGDSTLRGHYPLETQVIREEIEKGTANRIDGEIIIPFFLEGGRFTVDDIHYVLEGEYLIPATETEYAKDPTFGYKNSDLKKWIEEKTMYEFTADDVLSISIDMLRNVGPLNVYEQLMKVTSFKKVIVNAFDYMDLEVFVKGLLDAEGSGKRFIFRTAASFVNVRGGITRRELLKREEIIEDNVNTGGLVIIGSYIKKTTEQLNRLLLIEDIIAMELNVKEIINGNRNDEIDRIVMSTDELIKAGRNVVIYTSREIVRAANEYSEKNLEQSVRISDAVVDIVRRLSIRPKFIIAKGGITSSNIGVNGLRVKKALVIGQVLPGVPVWKIDNESKFPNLTYVIFPGNVGNIDSLKELVEYLN